MMEDEERQRKLQAGKAKLAEYRQRKAQSDGQKKQKKKRKKPESDVEERLREEQSRDEGDEQTGDQNTVFSLSKTLRSGETVTHDQTYTMEPESEVSTTAEDCSSEVNGFQERTDSGFPWSCVIREEDLPQSEAQMEPDPQSQIQVMEDELAAKSMAIEELSRELEEIRRAFGPEGGQQLPEFEEALKHRDEIITQLTANMQQARAEKEEVMREFLQLTEQSQKLQIQFQQLQAGEILRSSSISSTAADLLQARQQITLFQQQLDDRVKGHQEKIMLYQQQLDDRDTQVRGHQEKITLYQQQLDERDAQVRGHQEKITLFQQQLDDRDAQVRGHQEKITLYQQQLDERDAQIKGHQEKITLYQQQLDERDAQVRGHQEKITLYQQQLDERDAQVRGHQEKITLYQQQLDERDAQVRGHQEKITLYQQQLDERDAQVRGHQEKITLYQQQLDDRDAQVRGHQEKITLYQQQLDERDAQVRGHQEKITLYQQQLDERDAQVRGHQEKITLFQQQLDDRDAQVRSHHEKTQEQLILITQLQERLNDAERFRSQSEESSALSLREKDLLNTEHHQRLIAEHQQSITQLQDQLLTSKQAAEEANKRLSAKTQELDVCERELTVSRQKERMSSGEILQLMKNVEDLQQRCHHHGSQSERDTLRAELDEMYGEQIVAMKHELRVQHAAEVERIREQSRAEVEKIVQEHQSEIEKFKGQVLQSNVLNVRVIELQQKLQETLVLREKAEQELARMSGEKLSLAHQVKRLNDELRGVRSEVSEVQRLRDALDAAQKANVELEVKHESEITNYKIKLDMLEREKDAVLDRMAESQESELERLRTQLLFSHEEELSRLRDDLQREGQLNVQNLRDEMSVRHREAIDSYEAKLKSAESERVALLQALKHDEESGRSEELERRRESEVHSLLEKINKLTLENEQASARLEELQDEIDTQRNTFSFAERNFQVNFQELKDEYVFMANAKTQLEERLIREAQEFEKKLAEMQTRREEVDGSEKHTTELMEKLQAVEKEKKSLAERLSLAETDAKRLEVELELRNRALVQDRSVSGGLETHHTHIRSGRERETPASTTASRLASHTHTHTREEQLSVSFSLTQQDETGDVQVDGDAVRASRVILPLEMDGAEHDECRLQLEAQRISLSQIHAAQLELLMDTHEHELRSREQDLRDTHEHELRDTQGLSAPSSEPMELKAEFQEPMAPQLKAEFQEPMAPQLKAEFQEPLAPQLKAEFQEPMAPQLRAEFQEPMAPQLKAEFQEPMAPQLKAEFQEPMAPQLKAEFQEPMAPQLRAEFQEPMAPQLKAEFQEPMAPQLKAEFQEPMASQLKAEFQEPMAPQLKAEFQEPMAPQLKAEFQECWAQLEERHRHEIERLKVFYQQQKQETQERFTSEILLLQQRLQELTGAEELFSVPSVSAPLTRDERGERHQDEECVSVIAGSGLWRELQAGQKAPCERELTDRDQDQDQDWERRIGSPPGRLQEKHQQELLEEEIAKVIVQMSVEFAQHTEHTRISKQARETSTAVQTGRDEEDEKEEEEEEEEEEVIKGKGHGRSRTPKSSDPELASDDIITERDLLREGNARLVRVLLEVLKTTAAAEETISHVEAMLEARQSHMTPAEARQSHMTPAEARQSHMTPAVARQSHMTPAERVRPGPAGDADDVSMFSAETDEELETPLKIPGAGLLDSGAGLQRQGAELQLESEEFLMSISSRLQSAVEKLLIAITDTSTQLEHARITQTELMREKFRQNEEMEELLRRQEELQERVCEENRAREQLALELHRAEGVIDSYSGEREALEQQLRERVDLQLQLEQELCVTGLRLRELEEERQQIQDQRQLLSRQQEALRDGAGAPELRLVEAALDAAPEADLLEETEKLMLEKVEVQRQAQKESVELQLQVKHLEAELEDQVMRVQELQDTSRSERNDLRQQIQALEKQLENNRRFMDEQAADREHERDVFQLEIHNLEQQLKNPPKTGTGSDRRDREVQELTRVLQEKSDCCSELLLSVEQLQRDVCERDEEIETLGARVRELEHTLMHRVEEAQHVSMAGRDVTLEAQLQTEREALDRKEKEIVNLEEQLEQFREELENKSEEVNQLNMQLEIQRKEISSHQQNQTRLTQVLEEKDRQIIVLNEQTVKRQHTDTEPEEEALEQKEEVLLDLEAQVEHLRSEQERLKRNHEEEVEQLNAVIEKLQQELSHIERKDEPRDESHEMKQKMDEVATELDTLKSEHASLRSKYERLREETLVELEEALREKTAAFVVVQAQVQALEESAGSRVRSLSRRVEELEAAMEEKDSELHACMLNVELAQTDADTLHTKVAELEDKLREKVAAVLVSQAQLGAIQTQTKDLRGDAPAGEMRKGLRASTHGPILLTEKLKELEEGLSAMQEDQELQKQMLSSSEDEVMEYERRLAVMMDILNQMRSKPTYHRPLITEESGEDRQLLSELLQEVRGQAASTEEELTCCRELSLKLQEEIEMKESTITQLQTALSQVQAGSRDEDGAKTAKLLQELQEVKGQASAAQQELQEVKGQASATLQELHSLRDQSVQLQELLQEREMSMALLKDQLHRASREGDRSTDELLQELQEVKGQAADTLQELQEAKGQAAATKEQLSSFRERSLKLQEEIEVRDMSIAELRVKVHELQIALTKSEEPLQQPPSQPKTKAGKNGDNREHHGINKSADASKDTPSLPHRTSKAQSESSSSQSRVSVSTQTEPCRAEDVQEMISGFSEKIGQMQELHAAEIMDMEARHISESESLKRENQQLELESRALRDAIDKLTATEGPSGGSERPAAPAFRDGYASDSSSDWSQRTGFDHLQENRSTPEGARRDPEPDLLPDRIKSLLREVHQEGMQVLSLSELPASEADRLAALQTQAWSRERDALIHTVDSLELLISRLQSHTQVDGDWRAELLSAVQQVFVHERDALKSVLYSHLERLDTADAVVHLSQLERALAEQDARHSEGMCVLSSADRSSLRSEIHQLRAQLHTLTSAHTQRHHVDTTGTESVREEEPALLETSVGSGSDTLQEIKTELSHTKLELESALKSQHKHLKELDTLRTEVSLKAAEVDTLNDTLAHEQKRARELQWVYEKEKCKSDRKQESEREEVEDLKLALEDQRGRVFELSIALERERETSAQLRDQEREAGVSTELQVQLDAQRARAAEISSALEKEKELNTQLLRRVHTSSASNAQDSGTHTLVQAEASCTQEEAGVLSVEALLQAQLVEKQAQVVQMMEELEKHQLDAVQRKRQWDEEKSSLQQDQNALGRRVEELRAELNAERDTVRRLEGERHRLQERVRELEGERHRLLERVRELEEKLRDARPADRTRDWVLQQKTTDATTHTGQNPEPKHTDPILSRLQLIAARINSLTSEAPSRLSGEGPDRESLAWLHSNVQDVMSLLQHIPSAPSALPESAALLAGGSSSLLNERLLRQNAELTGFVSRLTEEKNDLRNQLLNLEEELRRNRQKKAVAESGPGRQELVLFSSERESWARERSRLEKCVAQAEAELKRLRAEIRSDTLRDLTEPDNTALKRMYGKYLRAESFRKALVYQKKYLLLLLGGFQECEEATLSLIARMGGQPTHTHTSLESLSHQRRGFTRFRSAVRVCIALSRMRFLVKRWQRAGGTVSCAIVSRNGLSQISGADVRNESSFLHPGGVEVFRERRGTSRGRTGRDSPRSTASVQHRYHSMAGDPVGLPCSHLQNYDPDRALTDYISRLEALQRRLGSVQSGSSSYAQLHFGVRR
ncbi:A-kinase anchor protein 9 isoform X2 [Siphateles boraxobius]|uniref:A-kinase anchor protein 9 isoform X2 n=1 Tax=Siphateles boraxobius TaxID=180520 RepID=UPI004063FEA6